MLLPSKRTYKWIVKTSLFASFLGVTTLAFAEQPYTNPPNRDVPAGGTRTPDQPGGAPRSEPGNQPTSNQPTPGGAPQEGQRAVYQAIFTPINRSLAGAVSGGTRIVVEKDNMGIYLQATGLAPNMMHEQAIHMGSRCPDMTADKNNDGIIDAQEADAITGPVAVPLTLNIQQPPGGGPSAPGTAGANMLYPTPNMNGETIYINSFPVSMITSAFGGEGTPNMPSTPTTPSTPTQPRAPSAPTTPSSPSGTNPALAALENRVVEIRGIPTNAQLPPTVQGGEGGRSAQESIPVACGVLIKISE